MGIVGIPGQDRRSVRASVDIPRLHGAPTTAGTPSESALVELHIPVEVVPPAVRGVLEADRDPDGWRFVGTFRDPYEVHARFSRRASALPAVTADAAGHD